MKLLRILVTALAVVIVAGTVASASPSLRAALSGEPALSEPSVAPAPSPSDDAVTDPTDPSEPEPAETPSTDPSETETPPPDGSGDATEDEGDATEDEGSTAPDFTACEGLTGLDNAICRHDALLLVHPDNQGLQNALERLLDNKAKHDDTEGDTTDDGQANEGDDGSDEGSTQDGSSSCPGKSCESHGNGHGNGH